MKFFEEIKAFIGFGEDDAERLQQLAPHVTPELADVADRFCEALGRSSFTRSLVATPEDRREIAGAVQQWLREIFEHPFCRDPLRRDASGRRQAAIGGLELSGDWLPELLFGAMHILRMQIIRCIRQFGADELSVDGPEALDEAIASFEKAFDYELTRVMKAQRDNTVKQTFDTAATLAAGLSHEIYNPLNTITLNISLLERQLRSKVNGEFDWNPMLEAVRNEVQRIGMFTSELSDFSKPINIEPRWFDIGELLDELMATHAATLQSVGVELQTDVEGSARTWGDPDRLKEALLNLLHNAVEALGEAGTVQLRVHNNDVTVIEVSDDGPGIDPETRSRIFDLLYTTKASGTGLGLPLVRKIAEAHSGHAEAISPGLGDDGLSGATFRLTLPRPDA